MTFATRMQAWAHGKGRATELSGETRYFRKLALAIRFAEVDEAVLERQRGQWLDDLALMLAAQAEDPDANRSLTLLGPDGEPVARKG